MLKFIFTSLVLILVFAPFGYAKPGERFPIVTKTAAKSVKIIKTVAPIHPKLNAPRGFQAEIRAKGLGTPRAVTSMGSDIYIIDSSRGRIVKLRDQNQDAQDELRTDYLIGFDKPQDIVSGNKNIFVVDDMGVWKFTPTADLRTTERPDLILTIRTQTVQNSARILAFDTDKERLYLTFSPIHGPARIFAMDVETYKRQAFAQIDGQITALAISPSGRLWCAWEKSGQTFVAALSKSGQVDKTLQLTMQKGHTVLDIAFVRADAKTTSLYPKDWSQGLWLSITGAQPMLAYAPFSLGEPSKEYIVLIDGFSSPSMRVGSRNVWGHPTAIHQLQNGNILFLESKSGTLWQIRKAPPDHAQPTQNFNSQHNSPTTSRPSKPNIQSRKDDLLRSHFDQANDNPSNPPVAQDADQQNTSKKKPRTPHSVFRKKSEQEQKDK